MPILYLDTNIISYLHEPERYQEQPWYADLDTIWDYISKYAADVPIVYSPAHLSDMRQGYVKDKERALDNLQFIGSLTNNHCIVKYFSSSEIKFETRAPVEFFLSNLEDDAPLYQPGTNKIDMVKLVKATGLFKPYRSVPFDYAGKGARLAAAGINLTRTKVTPTWYAFLLDITEYIQGYFNEGHLVYKAVRQRTREEIGLSDKINGKQNPLVLIDKLLPGTAVGKTFQEIMEESFKVDPNNREELVAVNYMNLDLLGYQSDKLSEGHGYSNVTTDGSHCFYATYCDMYITNDARAAAKAKAIMAYFDFKVDVFDVSGFANHIKNAIC